MSINDDFSPITQGDRGAKFNPIFEGLVNGVLAPTDLTGATLTMTMQEVSTDVVQTCTGVWTIDAYPTTGKAYYAYSAADVATPGTWELSITITIAGLPAHADKKVLRIDPL